MSQTIGNRILKRRKELGLKQVQIQRLTGISTGNLSDIENGKKLPSAPTLISLSKILDCSADWILTGSTPEASVPILTNERENQLLQQFRTLSSDDQDELLAILNIKYEKSQRKKADNSKSSASINSSDN